MSESFQPEGSRIIRDDPDFQVYEQSFFGGNVIVCESANGDTFKIYDDGTKAYINKRYRVNIIFDAEGNVIFEEPGGLNIQSSEQ